MEALEGLLWSGFGFLGGFLIGRLSKDVSDIKRQIDWSAARAKRAAGTDGESTEERQER